MNNRNKYIGVSGVARVGKNLFCDIASDILREEYNLTSETFALATYLKRDGEIFLREKLGLNVWSEVTEEKSIFRPFLIWYGGVKRNRSKGRCWINMLDPEIRASKADVCFVSDVRFATYADDEAHWIQTELSGKLIHLSRYKFNSDGQFEVTPPASDDEERNDPMLNRISDASLQWKDSGCKTHEDARKNLILRENVRQILYKVM
jgi:hypothetical protein